MEIGSRGASAWGLIVMGLLLPTFGFAQVNDKHAAQSAKPYFESYRIEVPHDRWKGEVVYNHGAFDWNGRPAVALLPDGRIFLAWCPSIGFARGVRVDGSFSSDGGRTWSEAIELIDHPDRDDGDPSIIVDGNRLIVISQSLAMPARWDKYNPFPMSFAHSWWYVTTSDDGGKTWSPPFEAQHPYQAPGKRMNGLLAKDGALLLPYYYLTGSEEGNVPRLEGDARSAAGLVRSTDGGKTWQSGQIVKNCGVDDCDEPAAARLANGDLYCLLRTRTDHLYEMRSHDDGATWSEPRPSPILTGVDVPFALYGLGGDELVAVYNYPDRFSLLATYSKDAGRTWTAPKAIARTKSELHYYVDNPEIGQTKDGMVLVVWQQETLPHHLGKENRIARVNRAWFGSN